MTRKDHVRIQRAKLSNCGKRVFNDVRVCRVAYKRGTSVGTDATRHGDVVGPPAVLDGHCPGRTPWCVAGRPNGAQCRAAEGNGISVLQHTVDFHRLPSLEGDWRQILSCFESLRIRG